MPDHRTFVTRDQATRASVDREARILVAEVAFDARRGRIEATDTTLWFGFTDDIVVRVQQAGSIGARVDVRSKSRMGTFDYGRNAQRVQEYLKSL